MYSKNGQKEVIVLIQSSIYGTWPIETNGLKYSMIPSTIQTILGKNKKFKQVLQRDGVLEEVAERDFLTIIRVIYYQMILSAFKDQINQFYL